MYTFSERVQVVYSSPKYLETKTSQKIYENSQKNISRDIFNNWSSYPFIRYSRLNGSSVHSMQNQSQKTAEGLIYIRHKLQILEIFTKIASLPCSLFPVPCSLFQTGNLA